MSRHSSISAAEIQDWRQLYEGGMTGRQIGDGVGRDATTVIRALRRVGVQMRPSIILQRAAFAPPPSWMVDWCDECCKDKPLNPVTGWCHDCSHQPRRKATA